MTFKVSDNQYGRPHLATAALLYFFAIFLASHILRVNCFKIARDRPKQLMYTIFSIKRIIFCRLYTDCPGGRTDAVARHVSFPQITCLYLFSVQDGAHFLAVVDSEQNRLNQLCCHTELHLAQPNGTIPEEG